ncbi:MAG: HlyD family efflux transporter periplasmic adaptor subunit [Phycisphaerales bacterium]|nr:MAG: HlyD family efflux transporter periplasmic adaptor subunit [Phycisphaerales bacterium]
MYKLYQTRPVTEKVEPVPLVPLVSVEDLIESNERVTIRAFGTVIPAQRITLRSEISGRIVEQHPALMPGGVITEGNEVLRIAPTDYELRVKQEEVAVELAEAEFELERGQQVVAAKEWAMLKDEIDASEEMADFALRKPQRRRAVANIAAAKNRLALAKLDLERTILRVPFNALVLDEFVDEGQLVTPQTLVANLIGTDRFWVQVSVPFNYLDRIRFADEKGRNGSQAKVFVSSEDGVFSVREAYVLRLLGDLSESGRMARVLVAIDDPLGFSANDDAKIRPVLINSYVRVEIEAGVLKKVYEIPRIALRENNRVWVRDAEGHLQIHDVNVVWSRRESVLVTNNFSSNEKLIVSRLAVVLPGMPVRVGRALRSSTVSQTQPVSSSTGS